MDLAVIRDPFATVWVAVYEPLIVQWLSRPGLQSVYDQVLKRELSSVRRPLSGAVFRAGIVSPPESISTQPLAEVEIENPRLDTIGRARTPPPGGASNQRKKILKKINEAFKFESLDKILTDLKAKDISVATGSLIQRELSPLGIAHFYRQLYFDAGAGVGPIEQTIAVAPLENLEVVERSYRRRTFERLETHGIETTNNRSIEEEVVDEISETVQSSISRDMSIGLSARAEGTVGVFSAGGSTNVELGLSTEQAREMVRRRMLGTTRSSAEMVRRTVSVSVRTEEELGEEYSVRRVLRNETEDPVNYALRRVMRKVRVKLQSMGPHLVWQLYLCSPGRNLVTSRMVMYPEASPVSTPHLPPGAPPAPEPSQETGVQVVGVSQPNGVITLSFPAYADRVLKSVIINDVNDAAPEGKDPDSPVLLEQAVVQPGSPPTKALARIDRGSARRLLVNFTAYFEPSESSLNAWNAQVEDARANYEAQQLQEEFERSRRIIEAKRNISSRPSSDLRQEERYEILRRMVEEGFGAGQTRGPAPVEIELFHRFFEISSIFYYVHPSWWRPRYSGNGQEYEITDESNHAPFGASLGWALQLDGDRRRNEFLNSPWVRVCVPVRPGQERAACEWLAEHVEGKTGFSLDAGTPTGDLLAEIEDIREKERSATPGPDYVSLDGEIAPSGQEAADIWPVVDEFEVLEPTEGFIYERVRFP